MCTHSGIEPVRNWSEIGNRKLENLLTNLARCSFQIDGKTTFKDEFVTCGGVELKDLNTSTLEHNHIKKLYFCGEVLNIDGITGGFNFQSAWSTAHIVSQNVLK